MSSSKRTSVVLSFQIVFIILDVVINVAAPMIKGDKLLITFLFMLVFNYYKNLRIFLFSLSLFSLQDFGIILAFSSIILNIYSSQMYHVGMADILYRKYRLSLLVVLIYFILCTRDHVWMSFNYNLIEENIEWPLIALILHNLQRFCEL